MKVFFVVFARDAVGVSRKAAELDNLGYPHLVVCGESMNLRNVVYREPRGKYDAVNFSIGLIPSETDLVVFNDVDTKVHNLAAGLSVFEDKTISLACARVNVDHGPQFSFYVLLDRLRSWIPIAASGELMLIRYKTLKNIMPLKPCKAEDTYMLFKVLERGEKVFFSSECYVNTRRTQRSQQEEQYKRRTVGGIYQALFLTKPPAIVRFFYATLPFISPLLLSFGKKGYYWTKGILLGFIDSIKGDQSGSWPPNPS